MFCFLSVGKPSLFWSKMCVSVGGAYDMTLSSICQYFGWYFGYLNKNGWYSVFQSPKDDSKIQFLIEDTRVTVSTLWDRNLSDKIVEILD